VNQGLGFFCRSVFVSVAFTCTLTSLAPAYGAETNAKIEKHARKVEKRVAKFRTGTVVQVDLRDDSEALGSLRNVADGSFEITNADSNKVQTFEYTDVARVKQAKEYIGEGSEPDHHFHHWLPVLISAAAVGGGVAAYEAVR
jgi:hypothetical protein